MRHFTSGISTAIYRFVYVWWSLIGRFTLGSGLNKSRNVAMRQRLCWAFKFTLWIGFRSQNHDYEEVNGAKPVPRSSSLKTMSKIFLVAESQMEPIDQMQEKKNMPSNSGVNSVSDLPWNENDLGFQMDLFTWLSQTSVVAWMGIGIPTIQEMNNRDTEEKDLLHWPWFTSPGPKNTCHLQTLGESNSICFSLSVKVLWI